MLDVASLTLVGLVNSRVIALALQVVVRVDIHRCVVPLLVPLLCSLGVDYIALVQIVNEMDLFLELIDVRLWRLTLFPEILKCIDQSLSLLGKVVLVTSIHLFIRDNLIPTNRKITYRLTDTLVKRDFSLFDFLIEVRELFVGHNLLHVVEDLFSSFSLVVVMIQC